MTYTHTTFLQLLKRWIMLVAGVTLLIPMLVSANTAQRVMYVELLATDEFAKELVSGINAHLHDCNVLQLGTTAKHETENRYTIPIFFAHEQAGQACNMSFSARGYVETTKKSIGNLTADKTVTLAPAMLQYGLKVTAKNHESQRLPKMDVFYANESPQAVLGDVYYFAPTQKTGHIEIDHPAYKKHSNATHGILENVVLMDAQVHIEAAPVMPLLTLDVDNEFSSPLIEGNIHIFNDIARTKLARQHTIPQKDAVQSIDSNMSHFAISPGAYYVKITKNGYNDHHERVIIPTEGISKAISLDLESANTVSPRRSKVLLNKQSALANGVDTITINVELRSSDDTTINGKTVSITSSRASDVITMDSTVSQQGGKVLAYINSTVAGESVLTVKAGNKTISQFPSIVFQGDMNTPSPHKSTITATPSPILIGSERVSFTIIVNNEAGDPMAQIPVTLTSDRVDADTIECTQTKTADNGQMSCSMSSKVAGTSLLTFKANNVIIGQQAVSVSPLTN